MGYLGNFISCLIVSVLWGSTNPLIKKSTTKINRISSTSSCNRFFNEIKYLLSNWEYLILILINQSGSVLFFITLQNADLSLAVPVTNALTLVFTGATGAIFGEQKPDIKTLSGIALILIGITFCVLDKAVLKQP